MAIKWVVVSKGPRVAARVRRKATAGRIVLGSVHMGREAISGKQGDVSGKCVRGRDSI